MKKGKFLTLTDVIQGGGLPVHFNFAMATAVNLDVMWEDIRPVDSPKIVADIGTKCQAHIISNVHLEYDAGYSAYLTLVYSGEVSGYGLPTPEDIILSIKNGDFKFNSAHHAIKPIESGNQLIMFKNADAEKSLKGFFGTDRWFDDNCVWFNDDDSKIILNGYSESLNTKPNPVYNCFDKGLREALDASIRESAIELLRQPPKY